MAFAPKDAEAAAYAIEAAVCLVTSIASSDYAQACVDAIALAGWVRNTFF